jgi:RHS repeat-associated protein
VLDREYDAWGEPVQGGGTSGYAFTGREWDSEIDRYFYRSRYYDPQRAAFDAQDEKAWAAGPNLFRYVENGPSKWADPFGYDIVNNSNFTVWVKPELTKQAVMLPPKDRYPDPHDGFAIPGARPNEVYKTVQGIDVTINPDGTVTESGGSFTQKIGQFITGGWKDEGWVKGLNERGDDGWNDLHSRSRADALASDGWAAWNYWGLVVRRRYAICSRVFELSLPNNSSWYENRRCSEAVGRSDPTTEPARWLDRMGVQRKPE